MGACRIALAVETEKSITRAINNRKLGEIMKAVCTFRMTMHQASGLVKMNLNVPTHRDAMRGWQW
jgi:hypothetical protein